MSAYITRRRFVVATAQPSGFCKHVDITLIYVPQFARARAMQQAYRKHMVDHPRDNAPSAGEIRHLGLLPDQKPEDVHIKVPRFIPVKGAFQFPSYLSEYH